MPEGDTVWLVATRLDDALSGDLLTRSDFRVPQLATADLVGRRVLETRPRGKHILTRVEGGLTLHTHLRMDGMWHLHRPGARWTGGPDWQVRVVLSTASWDAIGYRMPVLELVETGHEADVVGHLGPDLLDPSFDRDEAVRRLLADPAREIGQALLDQSNLAGIGNIYKAETLFAGRVSPWTPVGDVGDVGALVDIARRWLERNKVHASQSTTGDPRTEHWVYGRAGRPCLRCGTTIETAQQGGPPYDRATAWCPRCQPGPHPEPLRRTRRR
ncbi:Fpg/Nei family DNA glycosylase [Longivirga aurantiaca]|uniref:DNA-(apurinic or apyrimidinic site) lyase n=1 Tax=Longivirga aurantiaca TaxID=1837743 RepID=A0ABW1T122_9ACTN